MEPDLRADRQWPHGSPHVLRPAVGNTVYCSPGRGKTLGRKAMGQSLGPHFLVSHYDTSATKSSLNVDMASYSSNTELDATSTPGGLRDRQISS
jgi:hypothetical protein